MAFFVDLGLDFCCGLFVAISAGLRVAVLTSR